MIPIEADLHTHTTCSDGVLSPAELVRKADQRGIKVLAITDHDSISGYAQGREAADELGLELIAGVELSVQFHRRELHLLGYEFDVNHEALQNYLDYFSEKREDRAKAILDKLYTMGYRLDYETIRSQHPDAAIGRPHIARALVDAGYVKNTGRAFARYLGDRRPADVPKELPPAQKAIEVLHQAGGIAILAHPGHWVSDHEVNDLHQVGLDGVEIIHPSHTEMLTDFYARVATKLHLIASGGSDYHGKRAEDESNFGKIGLTHEQFQRFRLGRR